MPGSTLRDGAREGGVAMRARCRRLRQLVDQVEGTGDRFERLIDGGIALGLLLQHGQRMTSCVQRGRPRFMARCAVRRLDTM